MRIGVVGTGNMGRTLGVRWARAGHRVLFGSRDPGKARSVAGSCSAEAGDLDAAAAFGEVVLYTVRDVLPSTLLRTPQTLAGKIVIDCNNSAVLGLDVPDPDRRPGFHFTTPVPSLAERLAADLPAAHVVKAFNTVPARVIELGRERLARRRVSVFLCGDDAAAKAAVKRLAEELGFVAVDTGELERARLVETAADLVRLHILGTRRTTTISFREVEELDT
jgi:8-hydroxy-5-deazaflavin:NADPH oxidoreductase